MALQKMWFNINGADRMITCDTEDTLATVIRRQGLTGTKIGCNAGQCGACSVILNGEVIRSCVKKMKSIPDRSVITTIEGIGTPEHLHPLQLAWVTYGAVQCGFCSPGFIVSAKGLLDQNPNPTREEVRAWFKKHRNLCRCTGYKPIVDAVMAAAKVMRGELTMEDISHSIPADGKLYGSRIPRRESGIARATGLANYGDDIALQMPENTLHLAIVSPEIGHANIKNIDFSEALKMPGVVDVITAKDIKGTNRYAEPVGHPRAEATGLERPILCDEKIFKYGDVVALVAADSDSHARAAAKAVKVELEPLPEYTSQLEAILPDAIPIHEGSPNLFIKWPQIKGEDTKPIVENADCVVEGSFSSTKEPHLPIEPDCGQAYIGADGLLTIQYKSQHVYGCIGLISAGIGVPSDQIRVIENESGGSFGYSVSPILPAFLAIATMKLNQPVTMTLTYPEHQIVTGKRSGSNSNIRMSCDKDGKINAMEYQCCYDIGAYIEFTGALMLKGLTFIGFPYNIPNVRGVMKAAFSNVGFCTTYRGHGGPQVFSASEAIVDMLAEKMGIDPFEFRYKNIARPGDNMVMGTPYYEYPMEEMMDMVRPKYEEAKKRCAELSNDKVKRGVGLALGGYSVGEPNDHASVLVEIEKGDKFVCYNTWEDVGQHAEAGTLLHMFEALRPMNVPYENIRTEMNDTKMSPDTGISGGSRQHVYAGLAIIDGCNKLMDLMRKPDGSYRTYEEMVAEGIPTKVEGTSSSPQNNERKYLDANTGQGNAFHMYLYNIFMVEVEVEVATGKAKVVKIVSVSDNGTIGNLLGVEGQAYGGMSHSVGFALKEDFSDPKKHSTMVGAGILEIDEMPDDIELLWHETARPWGPHGSAGASENFQSSLHVAVLNAINNAVGVRIHEIPAKPAKIKAAMEAKAKGEAYEPEKYYLGLDLYDELEYLAEHPVSDEENF